MRPMISTFLLAMAVLVPAGAGAWRPDAPAAGEDTGDTELPQAMMTELARMAAAPLWPGFEPGTIPVAIFDGETTFLFHHPAPPASFSRPATEAGPWTMTGRHPAIVANSSAEIGGVATATVLLDGDGPKDARSLAALTLHEMFHVFQERRHPDWGSNETELFSYPMTDVDNAVGLATEELVLARAVQATESAEAAAWVALFVEVRSGRFERLPEGSRHYERGVELREGTARYIQSEVLGTAGDTGELRAGFEARDLRRRCYHTGLAQAVLLDRLVPIWKGRMEAGHAAPLDALLAAIPEVIAARPARLEKDDKERLAAAGAERVAELRTRLKELRKGFDELAGTRVVVKTTQGRVLSPRGFDPMNAVRLGGSEVFHSRFLKVGCAAGEVELMNTPAVTVGTVEHPLFHGITRVEAAGIDPEPEVVEEDGTVTITGTGIRLRFTGATLYRDPGGRLVVTIGRSAGR